MWRRVVLSCVFCVLSLAARQSFAQNGQSGLISPTEASRVGLKRAWYTHVEIDRAKGRLAHWSQHISTTVATTIFEIKHDAGQLLISEKHLDPFGLPLGKDGAKRVADEKV